MFTATRSDGAPITAADARERARLETLVEVTQHKGDSECRAGAQDELCNYEKLPVARMMDMARAGGGALPPNLYVREALRLGLALEQQLGANPFRFGLIGSTDTHLAAPGLVDEDQFRGHAAGTVTVRWGVPPYPDRPDFNPGGLAVLWAEENSRDALFEAMRRREAYGTSGPRITVRFFGGWSYSEDLCGDAAFAQKGYAGGVPMGGELPPAAQRERRAPRFAVWALRDPGDGGAPSAPLQRIQIVKGWAAGGESRERVYEVAGDPHSGAGLDLATCTPAPGADQLCRVWTDPDFDPRAPAFYYARVVENPSCRWNTYACRAAARRLRQCERGPARAPRVLRCQRPKSIQERAWTSPIWYSPRADR